MDKISPCLWFNGNAEEAVNFYVSIFPNSRINEIVLWPMDGTGPNAGTRKGDVLALEFVLAGRLFRAINSRVAFPFTEAISLAVACKDQAEVDLFWNTLVENGGKEVVCGWLKDKFGLSWQIVPQRIYDLLVDPDTAKAARAMTAMLDMVKIDLAAIEKAVRG
ncbi:MAG TPA: VOC family protein [Pseudorhodoplanes sp.]|nr:VOC family protein [Pseudorhodoplanes sp.]